MHYQSKQMGMTMWGLAMMIAVGIFFLLLTLKLLPPYLENMKVRTALENVTKQANVGGMPKEELMGMLQKRFDIEDVRLVDLRKDLKVETQNRVKTISIAYEARIPLAYNISALLAFDNRVQVKAIE